MNTDPKNTADAKQLLHYLANLGINATVAGGFLRDGLWGGEARDIDLYFGGPESGEHWKRALEVLCNHDGEVNMDAYFTQGDAEYDHQSIQAHVEVEPSATIKRMFPFLVGRNIDFVLLRWDGSVKQYGDAQSIIEKFNIGCSQIGIANFNHVQDVLPGGPGYGAFTVITSEHFEHDLGYRTGTILREHWGWEYTARNMLKLRTKYPDIVFRLRDDSLVGDIETFRVGGYAWQDAEEPFLF